jgi:hypothetical protein
LHDQKYNLLHNEFQNRLEFLRLKELKILLKKIKPLLQKFLQESIDFQYLKTLDLLILELFWGLNLWFDLELNKGKNKSAIINPLQ